MASSSNRAAYVITTDDVERTANFYTGLAQFERRFSSDWYVALVSDTLELGIVDRHSRVIPLETIGRPQAGYLSLATDDLPAARQRAQALGAEVRSPAGLFGQRRTVVRDPNGVILELSAPDALAAIA